MKKVKNEEKEAARVGPSVPCVAPTGSTAERQPAEVTAAKRPDAIHLCHRCEHAAYVGLPCLNCGAADIYESRSPDGEGPEGVSMQQSASANQKGAYNTQQGASGTRSSLTSSPEQHEGSGGKPQTVNAGDGRSTSAPTKTPRLAVQGAGSEPADSLSPLIARRDLTFLFRCRECEQATSHRFVAVGIDRIIVQCLACAETRCIWEAAAPADARASQAALVADTVADVLAELRAVGEILRARPQQAVIDAAHEVMLALDLHESGALRDAADARAPQRAEVEETKADVSRVDRECLPERPLTASQGGGCLNCGEAGGYATEEVGPFCSSCWEYLREHFEQPSP